jgi:sugar phosphate isomerase/epimerase
VQFGASTQLYHAQRLGRAHLAEIAAHGFDTVEIIATRSHLDYHDGAALDAAAGWLTAEGLRLHAIHAPVTERFDGRWVGPFSNASPDAGVRERAVRETLAALDLARRVPVSVLVVHLGLPDALVATPRANSREAARRSVETIAAAADRVGVRVALEVIPNALSTAESLVAMVEDELERPDVGICLDMGHAHLMGDLVAAIETLSGTLIATHVHDNHGARDEHLPPFEGTIAWAASLMALQKVGYDGTLILELASADAPAAVLARAASAKARLEATARSWT